VKGNGKSKTLKVGSVNAVQDHLDHGDTVGTCPNDEERSSKGKGSKGKGSKGKGSKGKGSNGNESSKSNNGKSARNS